MRSRVIFFHKLSNRLKNINLENEVWSEVIRPKVKWYDVRLKEVWDYRDLIFIFVKRDFSATYKQTLLGPLWFFLGPLFTVFTYTFVYKNIANISTDGIPAPLFYLAGTTLWNYFTGCFGGTSSTFVSNAGIFGKVYFPRLVSPISIIFSNLLKLGIQLLMFMIFWSYSYSQGLIHPNKYILLLPILIIILGGIALGAGIIVSALTTKYRDLTNFVGVGVSLLMFASPIIYPVSEIPKAYKPFLAYNPISPIIETFRYGFTGAGDVNSITGYGNSSGLGYSFFFMCCILTLGIILFNKSEKSFMDTV